MNIDRYNASIIDLVKYDYNENTLSYDKIEYIKNKIYKNHDNSKECCFCLNKININENVIKCIKCNNIFHYEINNLCNGLKKYLFEYSKYCPYCKNIF